MLKVGQRVRISESSQFYKEQGTHQGGIITHIRSGGIFPVYVRFSDNYTNCYREEDLILVKWIEGWENV